MLVATAPHLHIQCPIRPQRTAEAHAVLVDGLPLGRVRFPVDVVVMPLHIDLLSSATVVAVGDSRGGECIEEESGGTGIEEIGADMIVPHDPQQLAIGQLVHHFRGDTAVADDRYSLTA